MQGFALGLQRNEQSPIEQINNLSKRLTQLGAGIMIGASTLPSLAMDQRSPVIQSSPANTIVQGDTIHITVQAQPNMSEQAIARAIANALEQRDRQKAARLRSSYATY